MKRLIQCIFLSLLFLFLLPPLSHAVRYAECDACGYCIDREAPESWESCRDCLYPGVIGAATNNKTLEVITNPNDPRLDPAKKALNQPIPPAKGKYYTQLGCVDTSFSSFSDPGAVGGVLNFILTKLIFPATGVLAFGTLIYGSFILITAQGAEMQIARGKRYVTGSIVGLIFTFSVVLMVNIIGGDILRIPGFGEGQDITIMAAGSMAKMNADQSMDYVQMNVYKNGNLVHTYSKVTGNLTAPGQSPQNTANAYTPHMIRVEIKSGDVIGIEFLNDNCAQCNGTGVGDVNLHIQSVTIDGVDCTNYLYSHAGENYVPIGMNWGGMLTCTAP